MLSLQRGGTASQSAAKSWLAAISAMHAIFKGLAAAPFDWWAAGRACVDVSGRSPEAGLSAGSATLGLSIGAFYIGHMAMNL